MTCAGAGTGSGPSLPRSPAAAAPPPGGPAHPLRWGGRRGWAGRTGTAAGGTLDTAGASAGRKDLPAAGLLVFTGTGLSAPLVTPPEGRKGSQGQVRMDPGAGAAPADPAPATERPKAAAARWPRWPRSAVSAEPRPAAAGAGSSGKGALGARCSRPHGPQPQSPRREQLGGASQTP